ncbi:MAG: DUF4013 domain-containing protein [Haloferacaceae archaeon]
MLTESIEYLRNSDDWVLTVVIGGVLGLLSVFVVPTFLVLGYAMRVVRRTMRGDEEPPVFDDWGDLFVDGLKAFVVAFVYGFVPGIVAMVFVGFGFLGIVGGSGADSGGLAALGGITAVLGVLLALVLGLVAAYITPAALANYAETDRIGAGFEFGALRPVLTSGKYATAWLTAVALLVGSGIVAGVVGAIPLLGLLLGPIAAALLGFYATVAAYYVIGRTWGDLHEVELREGEVADRQPAV